MENLINVTNYNGKIVVSSRDVARDFGKEHRGVLRDIDNLISNMGVAQNCVHLFIETQYQHEQNKQWYREYLLTRDGFSLLVMGFTGAPALQWKLKYIDAFNKMEQALRNQIPQLSEKQQCILAIYDGGQGAIQGAKRLSEIEIAEAVAPLEAKIEEQAPRVEFANRVSASEESITLEEFAKVISDNKFKISKIRLMELLLKKGYLNKSKGKSEKLPSQYAIDRDMLELIEIPYQDAYGRNRLSKKTMVTAKGQEHIFKKIDRWIKEEELELEEIRKVIELAQQDMNNEILIVRGI